MGPNRARQSPLSWRSFTVLAESIILNTKALRRTSIVQVRDALCWREATTSGWEVIFERAFTPRIGESLRTIPIPAYPSLNAVPRTQSSTPNTGADSSTGRAPAAFLPAGPPAAGVSASTTALLVPAMDPTILVGERSAPCTPASMVSPTFSMLPWLMDRCERSQGISRLQFGRPCAAFIALEAPSAGLNPQKPGLESIIDVDSDPTGRKPCNGGTVICDAG